MPNHPPPLVAAFFPTPLGYNTENSSRTTSSGSKRKYAVIDNSSNAGRSRTRASSMSDFNNNTKGAVWRAGPTVLKMGGFGGLQSAAVRGHVLASRERSEQAYPLRPALHGPCIFRRLLIGELYSPNL